MAYESLNKIFYKNKNEHKKIYERRFLSPFARHFNFEIKQFNHNNSFMAFYNYSEDLVLLIEKIYRKHQHLLTLIESLPQAVLKQFELYCIIDEVHSTSAIEGIHSTHRELKDVIEGNSNSKYFSSIIKKYEILTSNETVEFETCKDIRIFYDDFVNDDITADNPKNKPDGKIFRLESVDVKNSSGKILHRGITPEGKIIENMEKALNILNDENIPALIRIAVFHYIFVYIHPFYDGNGRTARFISSYYIAKIFHYLPALRLSYVIKNQRKKYYDLIHDTELEINCGDITPFILGFCLFVYETFEDICKILTHKTEQLNKYENKIFERFNEDELTLKICLNLLYGSAFLGQGITMENLVKVTSKSRNTIKERLNSLPEKFLITDKRNKKNFYKLNTLIFKDL